MNPLLRILIFGAAGGAGGPGSEMGDALAASGVLVLWDGLPIVFIED